MKIKTPRHLDPDGKRLFRTICAQFGLESDDRALHWLTIACEQFDRMKDAARIIAEQGATVRDRYNGTKANPALAVESRAAKTHALALTEALKEAERGKRAPVAELRTKIKEKESNVASLELVRAIINGEKP